MSEDARPDNKTLTRREVLTGAAALTVSVVVPGVADAATPTLVSTIFGGRFEKEYRKAIADPFEKEHGVEVVLNYGNAGQWLTNAMVNQPNPRDRHRVSRLSGIGQGSARGHRHGADAGGTPERRRRLRRLVRRLQPPSRRSRLRILRYRLPDRHGRCTDLVGRSLGPEVQGKACDAGSHRIRQLSGSGDGRKESTGGTRTTSIPVSKP